MISPAIKAEFLKIKSSGFLPASFAAFALAPVMGGVFMLLLKTPDAASRSGGLAAKASAMNFHADWPSYLNLLSQAVGVGGILIFGFVISWLFGREYSDGTAKDMMALPTSRRGILNAKFTVYSLWCLALATSNLLVSALVGLFMGLPASTPGILGPLLLHYYVTTGLTIVAILPVAFFALWGRGFLSPLGFVALTLVFAQIIAATGQGAYFPWAVPGLYSGASGAVSSGLSRLSYLLLFLTALAGYAITTFYWSYADHTK